MTNVEVRGLLFKEIIPPHPALLWIQLQELRVFLPSMPTQSRLLAALFTTQLTEVEES